MMDTMLATLMMTSGFMMMVMPQGSVRTVAGAVMLGFVMREAFGVSYEPDEEMDVAIHLLDTIH